MLFHSVRFLYLFAVTFALYWGLRNQRARMVVLLCASIYFYARWNPWLVGLVLGTALFDYWIAIRIEDTADPGRRRWLLAASLSVTLGLLAYFKYTNFFVSLLWPVVQYFGSGQTTPLFQIVLPLGISFYTFETVSYVVDVYRGRLRAERDLLDYSLFLLFFPHLIAGPIVRPADFLPQLRVLQRFDWTRMELGLRIFTLGLLKKAVIADQVARLVDPVYAAPADYASAAVWAATLGYAIQIYCDFSGYSDMAIGCAHAFGLRLPQNFDLPYLSLNIAEFWRRWHISLSSWLRDYLYIPLGGNRGSTAETYRNLWITMLLGGLWHGAAWTFVFWGAYHGALLALHRALPWPQWLARPVFAPARAAVTFFFVCLGWVLFRARSLADAGIVYARLLWPSAGVTLAPEVTLAFAIVVGVVLAAHLVGRFVDVDALARRLPVPMAAGGFAVALLAAQLFMPDEGGAFIYFQF
ncbi:MAG TPA: MBOAT family protein [Myxococcota bacterium]|nr:MBOAT family protein [Myxococcota bacterium]